MILCHLLKQFHHIYVRTYLEGKDVNLASLLIPQYSGPSLMYTSTGEKYDKPDPRLNRNLSITEFMQAFGTYKNIMCEGYPNRRVELDLYERDIIEMATRYKDFMNIINSSQLKLPHT